ncbi:hypothetical protein BZA70DRAFT_30172 [Myxozyma melibiosi]|uniref:DUF3074 domain-containing protein n=1 Tax=Myxozyma melibiosi TaxID=54550 RepID=A0ABR1FFQ4_9ASCO
MTSEGDFYTIKEFTLNPVPHPPSAESTLALVKDIIATIPDGWKFTKGGANFETKVYYKYIGPELWYARTTIHDGSKHPYEWFKRTLYQDLFKNMMGYFDVIKEYKLSVEQEQGWQGYNLKYTLPAPFAQRDLATWLLPIMPEEDKDEFYVVAMPADIPLPEDATTRGVYAFFHRVRKLENGDVEWTLGTTSDMKGNLPRWVQNLSVPGLLVSDVQTFVDWMEDNYKPIIVPEGEQTEET